MLWTIYFWNWCTESVVSIWLLICISMYVIKRYQLCCGYETSLKRYLTRRIYASIYRTNTMLIYIHGQGLATKIKQKCNNLYISISRLEASVKCQANNYRPISLLSSFNKILCKQITNFSYNAMMCVQVPIWLPKIILIYFSTDWIY